MVMRATCRSVTVACLHTVTAIVLVLFAALEVFPLSQQLKRSFQHWIWFYGYRQIPRMNIGMGYNRCFVNVSAVISSYMPL